MPKSGDIVYELEVSDRESVYMEHKALFATFEAAKEYANKMIKENAFHEPMKEWKFSQIADENYWYRIISVLDGQDFYGIFERTLH